MQQGGDVRLRGADPPGEHGGTGLPEAGDRQQPILLVPQQQRASGDGHRGKTGEHQDNLGGCVPALTQDHRGGGQGELRRQPCQRADSGDKADRCANTGRMGPRHTEQGHTEAEAADAQASPRLRLPGQRQCGRRNRRRDQGKPTQHRRVQRDGKGRAEHQDAADAGRCALAAARAPARRDRDGRDQHDHEAGERVHVQERPRDRRLPCQHQGERQDEGAERRVAPAFGRPCAYQAAMFDAEPKAAGRDGGDQGQHRNRRAGIAAAAAQHTQHHAILQAGEAQYQPRGGAACGHDDAADQDDAQGEAVAAQGYCQQRQQAARQQRMALRAGGPSGTARAISAIAAANASSVAAGHCCPSARAPAATTAA